jgi:hypothetical protein
MYIVNLPIGRRSQATNTMSNGTVAGIAVAGVVSLFILLGLLGFLYRRRARHRDTSANISSAQQNTNSSVLARSDSTARPAAASQMTTVPSPFYLSSPNPPSQDDGPSRQNSRKGHARFPSFPRVLQNATSSVRQPYFIPDSISESVRTGVF